jgi:hypothetical protein
LDVDYLRSLGLSERRNRWREACGRIAKPTEEGDWARVQERREAKAR